MHVPLAEQLSSVGQRLHFLENFNSVIDQSRIPVETVHQLLVLADELLGLGSSEAGVDSNEASSSVLLKALEQNIIAAKGKMEKLTADAQAAIESARVVITNG